MERLKREYLVGTVCGVGYRGASRERHTLSDFTASVFDKEAGFGSFESFTAFEFAIPRNFVALLESADCWPFGQSYSIQTSGWYAGICNRFKDVTGCHRQPPPKSPMLWCPERACR